jgi:hypothetical protein
MARWAEDSTLPKSKLSVNVQTAEALRAKALRARLRSDRPSGTEGKTPFGLLGNKSSQTFLNFVPFNPG